jgi:hypothetical protein
VRQIGSYWRQSSRAKNDRSKQTGYAAPLKPSLSAGGKLKSFRYLLLILIVSVVYMNLVVTTALAEDSNIIIFSQSHGLVNYESQAQGILKIGVTSFYPIKEITVNGESVAGSGDSIAQVGFPYHLGAGVNDFQIVVTTDKGKKEQRFSLNLGKKPTAGKKAFQLIGIAGASSLDNVASASEGSLSGSKFSLIVVPQYDMTMGERSTLRFKGILLRERFSKSEFSGQEISYTQIQMQWLQKKTFLGDINAGMGMNDIRTDNENPLLGADQSMTEIVVLAGLRQKMGAGLSLDLQADVKLRDSKAEATSENNDADAREVGLTAGLSLKNGDIGGNVKIGYSVNDAMGDYEDSSLTNYGLKLNYSIGDFVPGVGYAYKEKTKKNDDASGIKQKDKAATVQVKLNYKWKLLADSQLSLTWKSKEQTSNVSIANYSASVTTLALTYVF